MNIADKSKLYSEVYRVLKPMGRLVIYDIYKGQNKEEAEQTTTNFNYLVPWASDSSMSFLISTEDARKLLNDIGFTELFWEDKTTSVLGWFYRFHFRHISVSISILTLIRYNQ
jgi:hypothetical protein